MASHARGCIVFLVLLCYVCSTHCAFKARKFGPLSLESVEFGSPDRTNHLADSKVGRSLLEGQTQGNWKPKEEWKPEEKKEEWKPEEKHDEWKPEEKHDEWKPEEKHDEWKPEEKHDGWKPEEKTEEVKVELKTEEKHGEVKVEQAETKMEEAKIEQPKEEWQHDATQEGWDDKSAEELKVDQNVEEGTHERNIQGSVPEVQREEKLEVQHEEGESKTNGQEQAQSPPLTVKPMEAEMSKLVEEAVKGKEVQLGKRHVDINEEMPIDQRAFDSENESEDQVLTRLSEHQERLQQHDREWRERGNHDEADSEIRHEDFRDHSQRKRVEQHMQSFPGLNHQHEYNLMEHTPVHHEQEKSALDGLDDDWTSWEKEEVLKPEDKRMVWSQKLKRFVEVQDESEFDDFDGHLIEHDDHPDVSHLYAEHDNEKVEEEPDVEEVKMPSSAVKSARLRGDIQSSHLPNHAGGENVAEHLASNINAFSDQSKSHFVRVNQDLTSTIVPFLGTRHAPVVASVILYCLLILPLAVVFFVCEQVWEFLTLQKIILFSNIYLAVYFELLLVAALGFAAEPMEIFHRYSPSSYLVMQLLQAVGYILYLFLQTADVTLAYANGTAIAKSSATVQIVVATFIGIHYYFTVFSKATQGVSPSTSWKVYAFYSISFMLLCCFARIKRGKKPYLPLGSTDTVDTTKKN